MKNVVNLKELRENVTKYASRVQNGESFIIMKKSKPLFRISPIDEEDGWETVVDFTDYKKGGISAKELLARLKAIS